MNRTILSRFLPRGKIVVAATGLFAAFIIASSFTLLVKEKKAFYIIGDSTVRNGDGTGKSQQWGWGSFMAAYFDTSKISVQNQLKTNKNNYS